AAHAVAWTARPRPHRTQLSAPIGFPLSEQPSFLQALQKFREQLHSRCEEDPDLPAAKFLEPLGQWNALINAVSTYANGAELQRVSARDVSRYDDSGVNWRVVEGYGRVIAAPGAGLAVMLGHTGERV